MPTPLEILRINHINHIAADYDVTLAHYQDLLGAQFLMKIGFNKFTDGCLIDVGGEIFALLIPKIIEKAEGRQLTKLGPHYSRVELYVRSRAEAQAAVTERGIGLLLDGHADFLTVGADTEGVVLQVFDGNWHADPPPGDHYTNPKRTPEWWRDVHPIGYTGLRQLSFATLDLEKRLQRDESGATTASSSPDIGMLGQGRERYVGMIGSCDDEGPTGVDDAPAQGIFEPPNGIRTRASILRGWATPSAGWFPLGLSRSQ